MYVYLNTIRNICLVCIRVCLCMQTLIQLHGGDIGCQSPPLDASSGSEFYYSISHNAAALAQWKAAVAQEASDSGSSRKGTSSGKASASGKDFPQDVSTKTMASKTKNILVVDGNILFLYLCIRAFVDTNLVDVCLYQ